MKHMHFVGSEPLEVAQNTTHMTKITTPGDNERNQIDRLLVSFKNEWRDTLSSQRADISSRC